ncbi:hypothetical protein G5714_002126 [Onychostoma macrolepis]|uniref:PARP catalytic domain-containing protein n=1 Tax=Onychostoma macrolepis TaxID=369639 RepID=A0A7J6DE43_9TELE|nr:hypothetical protein G5714_002126 [Onychostoma macrolepis]
MGNCSGKQKKVYPGRRTYIMYHGTTMENALKIYHNGFVPSSGGMLGPGVYRTWHQHGYDTAWVPPNCGMAPRGLEEDCVYDPNRIKVLEIILNRRSC